MFRTLLSSLALGVVASLAAALLVASPALAHARWKSSTPGKGEAITASPARVEIQFTNDIQKISGTYSIQVVKDRGLDVTAGSAAIDDTDRSKLSVPLQANLSAGRYVVNWTNVSDEDGDPAEGAFSFYLNYQPNAVDLANDAQLEQIGFEEEATPPSDASPAVSPATTVTAATTTGVATNPSSAATTATPASTPASTSSDDGGLSTAAIIAIIVVASLAGIVDLPHFNKLPVDEECATCMPDDKH